MSRYTDRILLPDEKIVYQARVSLWSLVPLIVVGLALIFAVVGVFFLLLALLSYATTELAITNKRVIVKSGFISRRTIELNLGKIESIQVKQGVFGRIFNYGTIILAGAGNPQAPVQGISNPLAFRKAFASIQEIENQRLRAA